VTVAPTGYLKSHPASKQEAQPLTVEQSALQNIRVYLQPTLLLIRISNVMRKLAFLLIPFLGIGLAKSEKIVETNSETIQLVKLDPRKNYRAKMAKQYFGGGGGRCRKWNRFCGR